MCLNIPQHNSVESHSQNEAELEEESNENTIRKCLEELNTHVNFNCMERILTKMEKRYNIFSHL